jgi:hypothetical protein
MNSSHCVLNFFVGYFEDFLKYAEYKQSMAEILLGQVYGLTQQQLKRTIKEKKEGSLAFEFLV